MYCFSRIRVDGKLFAHLEHAIEKNNSKKLTECVPNIGLSCAVCNQTFKRIGEKKRKLTNEVMACYEAESKCIIGNQNRCVRPCRALRLLQERYSGLPDAEILLQPMGVSGTDSGEDMMLQYNVLTMEFEPAKAKHTYSDGELKFLETHINRFRLNDPKYRTYQLFDFIKNVVDHNGKMPTYEYNNLIVKMFRDKLSSKSQEEIRKICESIFLIIFPKMQR